MNVSFAAPDLDFHVDMALQTLGSRWLAVADIGGDKEVGIGDSARAALASAVTRLGPDATGRLLAYPSLLETRAHGR